ncbi:sugar transferase [Opitutus sp. ER46]|uniref:sugar transferase n=1 Tax=Opitutus sp. ER46 TaxID=2161864 RepID=UPI000D30ADC0|nr:sugar transferase [Opitutus sp. ER46]PTX90733.1 hypothetical protein DB354_18905 [Opitutus sp. ER46]
MNAILICPADRPPLGELSSRAPLVTCPLLGRTLIDLWIEALATGGAQRVLVLATDRPNRVRAHIGDGRRWGVQVEVLPTAHEYTVEEARARFSAPGTPWAGAGITLIDHLPGQPALPLLDSYASWFAAQRAWLPAALTPGRIGVREVQPGIWAGLRAEISPRARLRAPVWIGDYVRIGADAEIGPSAILDDRVVVETGARVVESIVGPDTFVGRFVSIERSLAHGSLLVNWHTQSSVEVPDPILLADLRTRPVNRLRPTFLGRALAAAALVITVPAAIGVVGLSLLRGEAPWQLRLGLRSQPAGRRSLHDTFAYYELTGAQNWLRRWPQFWNVVRGDMCWIGNRPLRPTQALALANDFERLWLTAPVGMISLADAQGCPDGVSEESIAHASYYAVHAGAAINTSILTRALLRAAMVWPVRGQRRKEAPVALQDLATRQEL